LARFGQENKEKKREVEKGREEKGGAKKREKIKGKQILSEEKTCRAGSVSQISPTA